MRPSAVFLTVPRYAVVLGVALLVPACGSSSGTNSSGTSAKSATVSAQDSTAYRAAVNAVFDAIVSARGDYEAGHGEAALRQAAQSIQQADEQGLTQLRGLHAPSSAMALHAQLTAALADQARALRTVLAATKLDTARLGDVVRKSNEGERIVNQINSLP